ncbi:hypothetical protein [Parasutterella secunda]|uniref:hypothetical protein n=1 Tax=Parasutterella secunda TaxID=626947 RepID=UPI0025A355B1|nr:hypothetical protein [Parasutterella secunda]MDM8227749.1 hypothetical protein [Parasutterella secunda]
MATAEQTVGAVLDATNKRYLVEHWESDDNLTWYDKYNDGWVEQYGIIRNLGNISVKNVDLPIEF